MADCEATMSDYFERAANDASDRFVATVERHLDDCYRRLFGAAPVIVESTAIVLEDVQMLSAPQESEG